MKSIASFLNAEDLMPHGYCLLWRPEIVWLHILSDVTIALSYYAIPLALFYFVRKRGDLPHERVFWLLGAFILLCGTTHAMAIWVLWNPDFAIEGLVKAVTAIVSVVTLIVSARLLPDALRIPSAAQLAKLNEDLSRNIRERESAQQQLQLAYSAMEETVAERTAELRKTLAELSRSNQDLDQFAYVASHDLREPLRGLSFHASVLLEDYREKLDETGVNRLKRLMQIPVRMDALINDLHYFARLGQGDLALERIDLNEVVHEIVDTADIFIREANASVVIANDLPEMICDRSQISRVIYNLIVNGIKYNDKEQPRVEVGFLQSAVSPEGSRVADVIFVRDNGIGMAKQFQDEIFHIFRRLNPETPDKKGTGMGLTFVRKIVERHGGRVWLTSAPGEATTFYFTLKSPATGTAAA